MDFRASGPLPPGGYTVASVSCRVDVGSRAASCAEGQTRPTFENGLVVGFESLTNTPGDTSVPSLEYDGKVIATASGAPEKTTQYANGEGCPGTCTLTTLRGTLAPPAACMSC